MPFELLVMEVAVDRLQPELVWVIGAGTMGAQIALQAARYGYTVFLVDPVPAARQAALERSAKQVAVWVGEQQLTREEAARAMARLNVAAAASAPLPPPALVIEAVPEEPGLKRQVLAELDRACPRHTILATNSSSLSVSAIEDAVTAPERVLNMHFYNPVWQRPLVELMPGSATSSDAIGRARRFALSIGVTPLLVMRESTGFIFNRVWRAIKKECLSIVDGGVASYEDVDRAWMIALGMRVGPFGFMDMVGLDVVRDIELTYYAISGDPSDMPPRVLLKRIERGELGVKTGKGFYTYPSPAFQEPGWLAGSEGDASPA
jgi:3-hydroxybutyryl-CoA dehydrogenase